jgi:hypothetical protein
MKTKSIIPKLLTLAVAVVFSGCASSGYKQADNTGESMAEFRNEIINVKKTVDVSLANLNQISSSATSDPRPAFKAFSKSVDQVEASRAKAKKRADEIKSKGSAYFKQWEKQLAEIANPEISKMAEARKAKLGETFGKVSPLLEEAKADFDPFLSDLKDLRIALGNDLTANGVIAAKDIIKKTNKTGAEVQTSLNALIAEMDSIAAMLTTAKVAPATKK